MGVNVEVGIIYGFRDYYLRVIYANGNRVMMEKWANGEVVGYSVITDPYLHDGKLAWLNGWHHPCREHMPSYDSPFEALEKAWTYMHKTTYTDEKGAK